MSSPGIFGAGALSTLLRGKTPTSSDSIPDSSESGGVGRPFKLMYRSLFASGLLPGLSDREDGVFGVPEDEDDEGLESRVSRPVVWLCTKLGSGSDWLTRTAGGMGVSSARSTMSAARTSRARGVVRGSARACAGCDCGSSPSRDPHKTNSTSEQSEGQELYGEPEEGVGEPGHTRSPRLEVVIM